MKNLPRGKMEPTSKDSSRGDSKGVVESLHEVSFSTSRENYVPVRYLRHKKLELEEPR